MNPVDDNTSQQANLPAPNPVDTPHGVSNGVEESLANMQPVINNDLIQPSPHSNSAAPLSPHSPSVADDVDLIEKEWVDKAKKIITETRDDPYRREQEVSRLQADYLRKRYGKELGVSN